MTIDHAIHIFFIGLFQVEKSVADMDVAGFVYGWFSFDQYGLLCGRNGLFSSWKVWAIWIWPNLSVSNIDLAKMIYGRYSTESDIFVNEN